MMYWGHQIITRKNATYKNCSKSQYSFKYNIVYVIYMSFKQKKVVANLFISHVFNNLFKLKGHYLLQLIAVQDFSLYPQGGTKPGHFGLLGQPKTQPVKRKIKCQVFNNILRKTQQTIFIQNLLILIETIFTF